MSPSSGNSPSPIGLLLPRVPEFNRSIRGSAGDNTAWWRRLWSRPRLSPQNVVRGIAVACESLIDCLLLSNIDRSYEYDLFCGGPLPPYQQWIAANAAPPASRFRLREATALTHRDSVSATGLWYEPHGNFGAVFQVRDRLAERAYPIVSTVHGLSIHNMLYDQFVRILLCDTYPDDSFVCSSMAGREALEKIFASVSETLERRYGIRRRFAGRYDLIPLPIDRVIPLQDKPAARQKLRLPKDCTFLLYLGLISPLKADLFPLLLALSECRADVKRHNLIFGVAGGGDEKYVEVLMQFAREAGFPVSRLRVFRNPSDDVKHTLFAAADIFTSPADNAQEVFGLTVIEAMAHGVPQVVADWSGYRETVVNGETGFLVPTLWTRCDETLRDTGLLLGWPHDHHVLGQSVAMDIECWKQSVLTLLNDAGLRNRMSGCSRKRVDLFSMDRIRGQYLALWSDLMARPPASRNPAAALQLERPRYYDWFHHFATSQLSPDTVLEPARRSQRCALIASANRIKPCVQAGILDSVFASLDTAEDLTLEALTNAAAGPAPPSLVVWHIMWALKQGLLRVRTDAALASSTPALSAVSPSHRPSP